MYRPVRLTRTLAAAAIAAVLLLPGCGDDSSRRSEAPPSPTESAETTEPPGTAWTPLPITDSRVVSGWVAYDVLEGWEVATEAEGLLPWEEELEGPSYSFDADELDVLVSLERSDGSARVTVAREPRYLRVPDPKSWADEVVAALAGPEEEVTSDGAVNLPHGKARRVVLEGPETTRVVATTGFGEQRVVLEALTGPEPEAAAEVDQVLQGIVLDPDVVVAPLLHRSPVLAWLNVEGERVAEVDLQVPSDWTQSDAPPQVSYRSPDRQVAAVVTFMHRDGRRAEDALREVLADPDEDWDPLVQAEHRDVGGVRAAVARMAPAALEAHDLATTWVVVAEVGEHLAQVVIDTRRGESDAPLLQVMFASLAIRTA